MELAKGLLTIAGRQFQGLSNPCGHSRGRLVLFAAELYPVKYIWQIGKQIEHQQSWRREIPDNSSR